jgi:hypothetical protein
LRRVYHPWSTSLVVIVKKGDALSFKRNWSGSVCRLYPSLRRASNRNPHNRYQEAIQARHEGSHSFCLYSTGDLLIALGISLLTAVNCHQAGRFVKTVVPLATSYTPHLPSRQDGRSIGDIVDTSTSHLHSRTSLTHRQQKQSPWLDTWMLI